MKRAQDKSMDAPHEPPKKARKDFLVTIYRSWCKNCGICVAFCPTQVFTADTLDRPLVTNQEACTGCEQCVLHCPDFAIRVDQLAPIPTEES